MSTNNADLTNGTDFDPNLNDEFRIEFYNGEYIRFQNLFSDVVDWRRIRPKPLVHKDPMII